MKKPVRRAQRKTNTTILLVVEGFTEEAFSKHLKACYIDREMHIALTVKNAKGHGPEGIVDAFQSIFKTTNHFDFKGAFYDNDVPCSPAVNRFFQRNDVTSFVSDPCVEALLISLQGGRPGLNTRSCKQALERLIDGDQTDRFYYERHFDRELLERKRQDVVLIHQLISFITRT